MSWLARPLMCDGVVLLDALDPRRLTDADLTGICLRMLVIFDTLEMRYCEGRQMPLDIFDPLDTLQSLVLCDREAEPRLGDWSGFVETFGEYYDLAGTGPITVDGKLFREAAARFAHS